MAGGIEYSVVKLKHLPIYFVSSKTADFSVVICQPSTRISLHLTTKKKLSPPHVKHSARRRHLPLYTRIEYAYSLVGRNHSWIVLLLSAILPAQFIAPPSSHRPSITRQLNTMLSFLLRLMTFYMSLAVLAFTAAVAISSWHLIPDNSFFHIPRDEHLVATNESTHSLLRGKKRFHPSVLRQMTAMSSKSGLIEYQPSNQFTITLHVFLVDTTVLMDDQSRSIFEATALNFIVDNIGKIDLALRSISDVKVVDQRLTWKRLETRSTTGIDVSFDADATVPGSVEELQLEAAIQLLFDSPKAKAFRRKFDLALLGGPSDEPGTTSEFPLGPVPLGITITAAGCISFILILCLGAYHVNKKEKEERNLSIISTVEADNKAVAGDQKAVQGQHTFPIQQAIVRLDDNVSSSSYVT